MRVTSMRELEASRKAEYARSEERIGITKEVCPLAGVSDPPEMTPPELLSSYSAERAVAEIDGR
jgi:hypothetical protein